MKRQSLKKGQNSSLKKYFKLKENIIFLKEIILIELEKDHFMFLKVHL